MWTHPAPFLVMGMAVAAVWGLCAAAPHADVFRVSQISLPSNVSLKVPESVIGTNLWRVNLRTLSDELSRQQPALKAIRITRRMPNTILVEAVPRIPLAQVRIDRWYPVDAEGFVLPEGSAEGVHGLIRIMGADHAGVSLRPGKPDTHDQLGVALRVVEALRRAPASISQHVSALNVADPQQIRLLLDGETEVRCGSEAELGAHLERLRATLKVLSKQQLPVRYIDVRFQEPVIGPRT